MPNIDPKSVRRSILLLLYDRYQMNPMEMLTPEDFLEEESLSREALLAAVHYLSDCGLIELMIGYNPPWFAAARITAAGIDLVENRLELDLRFPPAPGEQGDAAGTMQNIVWLMDRLTEEAEFSALDGERRKCMLRDIQFLRAELYRPPHRWRLNVIQSVLGWLEDHFYYSEEEGLPSFAALKTAIEKLAEEERQGNP